MPFTLSHIALVLPFKYSKRLSYTGLVVGSIVPDFEFYFQMKEGSEIAHTIHGILLFNLPLAIIISLIFHSLLRDPLIINLPQALRSRYEHLEGFDWLQYFKLNKLKFIISAVLGCSMHIFIDGFTHQGSLLSQYFPVLIMNVVYLDIPLADILQLFLSIVGLAYLLRDLLKNSAPKPINSKTKDGRFKAFWAVLISSALTILLFRLTMFPVYNSFWGVIIAAIGSVCYAWIISSITFLIYSQKKTTNANA